MITEGILGIGSGLIGSLLSNVFNLFTTKQNNRHEIDVIDARIRELQAESQAQVQRIQLEGDISMELAAQKSFDLSQHYGNARAVDSSSINKLFEYKWTRWVGALLVFLLAIGDVMRTWMRPAITIMLMLVTGYITFQQVLLMDEYRGAVTENMVISIQNNVMYLTFTVIGWWFGDRTIGKHARNIGRK